jgi:Protein of unknown function (DUF3631)
MPDTPVRPLAKLLGLIEKYVVMSPEQRLVVALWIVHTHCVDVFEQTPYLTVTSPERQCGKSRLLELIALLVARPWVTIMPSEAVLFRRIDQEMPTLLLDEVDAIFAAKTADRYEGLRALLNAGHRKGTTVPRAANFGADLLYFKVYSAKVLAGIGVMPSTITDRAIPIRLQRKTRAEKVAQFRLRTAQAEAEPLKEGIARWVAENSPALAAARPALPAELSDRMQEGCEPLLAIADALGYAKEARSALVGLFSATRDDEAESAAFLLLSDIRLAFIDGGFLTIGSESLCMMLAVNGNGWGTWYGRGLAPSDLAAMLRAYGVRPKNVRTESGVRKGYHWDDLHPAFERYLPPAGAVATEVEV